MMISKNNSCYSYENIIFSRVDFVRNANKQINDKNFFELNIFFNEKKIMKVMYDVNDVDGTIQKNGRNH